MLSTFRVNERRKERWLTYGKDRQLSSWLMQFLSPTWSINKTLTVCSSRRHHETHSQRPWETVFVTSTSLFFLFHDTVTHTSSNAAGSRKFKRQIVVIVIKMHEIPLISHDAFRACPLHLFTNQPANLEGTWIRETCYICLSLCVCVFLALSSSISKWKQRFPLSELQC